MKPAPPSIALPVSLNDWIVTPSIDFIKLTSPCREDLKALRLALGRPATVFVHAARDSADRNTITLQTPSTAQLQAVIDHAPRMQIYEVEFTLDFRPKGDPAGLDELAPVFRWFADCLRPSKDVPGARRKNYVEDAQGRYVDAPPGASESLTTYLWRNKLERVTHRLYMKFKDNKAPVPFPSVRLEAKLSMSACWLVGLDYAFHLADFSQRARRVLSPHFQIAAGIKPGSVRSRAAVGTRLRAEADASNSKKAMRVEKFWRKKGAMGAFRLGLKTIPDKEANKRIGDALDRLHAQLAPLRLPKISRADATVDQLETFEFIEENFVVTLPPIGVKQYERLTYRPKPQRKKEE